MAIRRPIEKIGTYLRLIILIKNVLSYKSYPETYEESFTSLQPYQYHYGFLIKNFWNLSPLTTQWMIKKEMTFRSPSDSRRFLWNSTYPEEIYKEQLLARKLNMDELFSPDGIREPVTVLEILPEMICKFSEFGYADVSYGDILTERPWITRPLYGRIRNVWANHNKLAGCKLQPPNNYVLGQIVDSSSLINARYLTVTGIGKGKGFGGTIARHGFSRGPTSHGSHHHRKPGSIGAGTDPGRVLPGKKMPGRYGNRKCTFHGLKILAINPLRNWLAVKGSVPGNKNSVILLTVSGASKTKSSKMLSK